LPEEFFADDGDIARTVPKIAKGELKLPLGPTATFDTVNFAVISC